MGLRVGNKFWTIGLICFFKGKKMSDFNKPEGQTTSDNFLASEMEKDFLRAQSGWGELSSEDESYLDKKGLKTPVELLKSYRELERAYSSKISLPKDGDKEALDKLYSRLGMPEDSKGFDICFAEEDVQDGEKFKQVCLENNILPQSAKALYEWFVKNREESIMNSEAERIENSMREVEEMQNEWGAKSVRNTELMKRGIRLFAGDDIDIVDDIEKAVGTKRMMEVFCRLGEAISEDNPVSFGKKSGASDKWDVVEFYREMFSNQ